MLTWTGEVTRFELGPGAPRSLSFAGSDRDEYARVYLNRGARTVLRFALGGGDDTLLAQDGLGWRGSEYVGGAGRGLGRPVGRHGGSTSTWPPAGCWSDSSRQDREAPVRWEFETSRLGAEDARSCSARRRPTTSASTPARRPSAAAPARTPSPSSRTGDDGYLLDCDSRRSRIRLYGDGGNDVLPGSRGKDLLVGGPGRDRIDGNANRDRCSGEKLESCEIKLR